MARSRPSAPPSAPDAADPERTPDRYDDRYDDAPVARFADDPVPPRDALRAADRRDDEPDPADRAAFRIGANLITLVVLVLVAWWLWRHVLAPALLGPG